MNKNPKIVRVDVDTQYGFCAPDGGLPVEGGFAASIVAARLNREAHEKSYPLVGSVDTHTCQDPEFQDYGGFFPPHCIKGTRDWLKMPETLFHFHPTKPDSFEFIGPTVTIGTTDLYEKALHGTALYFEKSKFSIFDNPHFEPLMFKYAFAGYTFEVYGVATDYCVKAAALGIKHRAPSTKVRLLLNACAAVTPRGAEESIKEMEHAGIEIVR